jgi:hypothetical protein
VPQLSALLFVLVVVLHSMNVPIPCSSSLPPATQSSVLLIPRGDPIGLVLFSYLFVLSLILSIESSFLGCPSSAQ